MKAKNGVNPEERGGWEELERIEGKKTVIRKYYMRKKLFSIKENYDCFVILRYSPKYKLINNCIKFRTQIEIFNILFLWVHILATFPLQLMNVNKSNIVAPANI